MGHAGGSLRFGEHDDEEWEGDAMEQSHQIEGSSVPIEGKDKDESTTVTAGYLATSSVSVLLISVKVKLLYQKGLTDRERSCFIRGPIHKCSAKFGSTLYAKMINNKAAWVSKRTYPIRGGSIMENLG